MNLGRELRPLNAKNDSRPWMRRTNLGHELKALNALNEFAS